LERRCQLISDPLGQVERIYAAGGLPLAGELHGRMRRFLGRNPQHKHGRHRYRLEDFDLSRQTLDPRFAAYRERHGVPAPS